jgi:nitroimidazol reductase NimA-like FMN-containing flavoprotein (pyridoxamine 5'-phosphate oxidase superfamily)
MTEPATDPSALAGGDPAGTDGAGGRPSGDLAVTPRTRLRRRPDRGAFDWPTVCSILDEGFVCHLGFVADGAPVVIPTSYARVDDRLYVHGAASNHALRSLAAGGDVCLSVTLIDGLVLARSAFHHSVNYRSVVVFGRAVAVQDPDTKRRALDAIVEHIVPGRSRDARPATDAELRATLLLELPVVEASAKVRTGGPIDDPQDLALAVWAGEVPLAMAAGAPRTDGLGLADLEVPPYAAHYRRPGAT